MITTILEKCLAELGKESPDISYIRGMIEVLLASQPQTKQEVAIPGKVYVAPLGGQVETKPVDEGAILDAKARAAVETIKKLGGETQ